MENNQKKALCEDLNTSHRTKDQDNDTFDEIREWFYERGIFMGYPETIPENYFN